MAIGIGVSVAKSPVLNRLYEAKAYLARVVADSGEVANNAKLRELILMLKAQGLYDNTKLLIAPILGGKWRTSGIYKYASKLYSVNLAANDATQTAEVSQPYQAGNIAPTELLSIKCPNGDARYLSHPAISFAANEAWSVSVMVNWNGISGSSAYFASNLSSRYLYLKTGNINRLYAALNGNYSFEAGSTNKIIGKNALIHFVAYGDGVLKAYINAVEIANTSNGTDTSLILSYFLGISNYSGSSHYYRIQSGAMTAGQITAEYNLLRSWIAEIESVQIGTQTWATSNLAAVATPLGNVIPEVQLAATWATSTTLYDAAYAAAAGDAAAKHYAGVKAAAMWCHYDNSTANGAVYNKLYNWYAASLLDLDMASAGYGWHVPTSAEFTTLQTYLGGDSVAGGKLKIAGINYWNSSNIGADNSSGFTGLGAGYRSQIGDYLNIKNYAAFWSKNEVDSTRGFQAELVNTTETFTFSVYLGNQKIRGYSIRLIKNS